MPLSIKESEGNHYDYQCSLGACEYFLPKKKISLLPQPFLQRLEGSTKFS